MPIGIVGREGPGVPRLCSIRPFDSAPNEWIVKLPAGVKIQTGLISDRGHTIDACRTSSRLPIIAKLRPGWPAASMPVKVSLAVLALVVTMGPWALDPHRALTRRLLHAIPAGLAPAHDLQDPSDVRWIPLAEDSAGLYRLTESDLACAEVGIHRLKVSGFKTCARIATTVSGLPRTKPFVRIKDRRQFHMVLRKVTSTNVRCLRGSQRRSWVGTDGGAARCVVDGWSRTALGRASDRSTFVRVEREQPRARVYALCSSSRGTIWWGGDGDRRRLGWISSFIPHAHTLPLADLSRTLTTPMAASGSVPQPGSYTSAAVTKSVKNGITDGRPAGRLDQLLTRSRDGSIWVGTRMASAGCKVMTSRFFVLVTVSQSTVFTVCEDHEGSIWVGTKHGLINSSTGGYFPLR